MKNMTMNLKDSCDGIESRSHEAKAAETYTKRIGNVVFHVTAFTDQAAKQTASQMILRMLEEKVFLESGE